MATPGAGGKVGVGVVLNHPPSVGQHPVNPDASLGFWGQLGCGHRSGSARQIWRTRGHLSKNRCAPLTFWQRPTSQPAPFPFEARVPGGVTGRQGWPAVR